MSRDRQSEAEPVELIADPIERAKREAENGVRQFRTAVEVIQTFVQGDGRRFKLTQALILDLHQKALDGIHPLAGTYRNTPVFINKSSHLPPRSVEVPDLVGEMCSYVNDRWDERDATHLAAYVLWRMNWIHPFADGNGRTARVVSYVILNVKLNSLLPGIPTIPDQIASDKIPYYSALEKSDDSWKRDILALSDMEAMLERMLETQLRNVAPEVAARRMPDMDSSKPTAIVVMGPSGVGKTTVAKGIAAALGLPFAEADDFHSAEAVEKMRGGTPLTDGDRWPWLARIRDWISAEAERGVSTVLTCSALKRSYRDLLREAEADVRFVFLAADPALVRLGLAGRSGGGNG